jgi:two-component system LytT family response regulator
MPFSVDVVLSVHDPACRRRLRALLESAQPARIVAECSTGELTVEAIHEHGPAVAVVDAQMPDVDGLAIVERVGVEVMPAVLFVTRLDHATLRALELHGLNYILEPFEDSRFLAAFRRAADQAEPRALAGVRRRLTRMLAGDEEGSMRRRIAVRSTGRPQFVELDDVRWVEGAGAFSRLHLDEGTHIVRATLDELAEHFPDGFVRIHSTLVRTSEVAEIQRTGAGDALVMLRDGRHLRVSEARRPEVVQPS